MKKAFYAALLAIAFMLAIAPAGQHKDDLMIYPSNEIKTVLQFHGIGPWTIQYVNAADDPRNQQ